MQRSLPCGRVGDSCGCREKTGHASNLDHLSPIFRSGSSWDSMAHLALTSGAAGLLARAGPLAAPAGQPSASTPFGSKVVRSLPSGAAPMGCRRHVQTGAWWNFGSKAKKMAEPATASDGEELQLDADLETGRAEAAPAAGHCTATTALPWVLQRRQWHCGLHCA